MPYDHHSDDHSNSLRPEERIDPVTQHRVIPNPPEVNPVVFESQHVNSLQYVDALDGTTSAIPLSIETAAVDLRTGAKQFSTRATLAIGVDGMTATPDRLFPCRGCDNKYRYTETAVTTCADCGIVLGIPCCARGQRVPRCTPCRRRHFWSRVCRTIKTLHEPKR